MSNLIRYKAHHSQPGQVIMPPQCKQAAGGLSVLAISQPGCMACSLHDWQSVLYYPAEKYTAIALIRQHFTSASQLGVLLIGSVMQ